MSQDDCKCGHDPLFHADYGPPASSGYMRGPCMVEGCQCKRFECNLFTPREPEAPEEVKK